MSPGVQELNSVLIKTKQLRGAGLDNWGLSHLVTLWPGSDCDEKEEEKQKRGMIRASSDGAQ